MVRRLMRKGSTLEIAIRLGEGRRAFGGAIAQMPEDTTADDRGQKTLSVRQRLCFSSARI